MKFREELIANAKVVDSRVRTKIQKMGREGRHREKEDTHRKKIQQQQQQ